MSKQAPVAALVFPLCPWAVPVPLDRQGALVLLRLEGERLEAGEVPSSLSCHVLALAKWHSGLGSTGGVGG